MEKVKLYFFK